MGIDNICYYCGKPATHLELLELNFLLYMCPEHYEAWKILQPVKAEEGTKHDCDCKGLIKEDCEDYNSSCRHYEDDELTPFIKLLDRDCPPDQAYCHPDSCNACLASHDNRKLRQERKNRFDSSLKHFE